MGRTNSIAAGQERKVKEKCGQEEEVVKGKDSDRVNELEMRSVLDVNRRDGEKEVGRMLCCRVAGKDAKK